MSDRPDNGGRPAAPYYDEETCRQAKELYELGATDVKAAKFFEISVHTLHQWVKQYPKFSQARQEGKDSYDSQLVEKSLLNRALGSSHPDVHVSNFRGKITLTNITKHYPPDTGAIALWLSNRSSKRWKNKQEVEHTGEIGVVNLNINEKKPSE